VDVTVKKLTLAHVMDGDISFTMGATKGILMRGLQNDHAAIERNVQDFNTYYSSLQNAFKQIRALDLQPEAASALRDLQDAANADRQSNDKLTAAAEGGDMTAAFAIYNNEMKPVEVREKQDATQISDVQAADLSRTEQAAESSATGSFWITGLLLALSCCVAGVFIFVVRQINALLRNSVGELADSSVQIASAAQQVSSSSQSLAQGSSEQAATIEETSSVSTEINSMAQRNTENSHSTADLVTRSQDGFARTNQSLTEMVDAMDGINASSQKISKIIKVIDEIAFQTNILALNAAVEAARAGEAGMGFAVVADEVRNLAQRCAQAAKDTADLIEESIQRANGGKIKVDEVAVAIRAITEESSKVKVLVDEINLGSVEQSRGIDQITRSITQMEQVTQSNAANAEESAAAAEELNAQAEAMKEIVKTLHAMVDGDAEDSSATQNTRASLRPMKEKPARKLTPALLAKAVPMVKNASLAKTVTRIKSAVKLPPMQSAMPVSVKAAANASFPMDDDFKEF
jgi:methyl-accepting chemotaxis protein/methyl-accepting chemotaxis protein-1 (serine sensor receptor)